MTTFYTTFFHYNRLLSMELRCGLFVCRIRNSREDKKIKVADFATELFWGCSGIAYISKNAQFAS